jgi:hypothetical protein
MKSKYKIGDMFNCFGDIIVITDVIIIPSYNPLYTFRFLHPASSNKLISLPYYIHRDDSELDSYKRIEI